MAEVRSQACWLVMLAVASSMSTTSAATIRTTPAERLDDFDLVADGDVVEVGKRPRQHDLVVADRPVAGGDAELFDVAVRVVAPNSCHGVLVTARLKLDVGRAIWTAVRLLPPISDGVPARRRHPSSGQTGPEGARLSGPRRLSGRVARLRHDPTAPSCPCRRRGGP